MKKQPSILRVLTARSFRQNKGRNLAAVTAIILTSMMFTTLFTLAQGMARTMTEMYLRQAGTQAHASAKQITDSEIASLAAQPEVVSFGRSIVVGLAENQALAGRQVEMRYASEQYAKDDFSFPAAGRLPQQAGEIALDTLTLERLGIPQELGRPVTLEWRRDLTSPQLTTSTFTLCGWWQANLSSYASMAWVSEDFALAACGEGAPAPGQICGLRMMSITFASSRGIEQKIAALLESAGLTGLELTPNLAYSRELQQTILAENLPMYAGMALVFLAGYLIIFNIFQISVAADIQFYGRLKTLGMTAGQTKKMIYGQGNLLCLLGIPAGLAAGYLLGIVLLPSLLATVKTAPAASADPVIFIGSALFTYLTVIASCLLPARMAGRVSPMEALRYTDADAGVRRKTKRSGGGSCLAEMAWANLWRNKKRTVMVICSLTLGLVLMSFFYAKNASFDMEKYLMDLTVADYQLDDATNKLYSGYNPESDTISEELLGRINALGGVEATGRLYSRETRSALSESTRQNLASFYTQQRLEQFASYDPTFPEWKKSFDAALEGKEVPVTVYGADGLILAAAAGDGYLLAGAYDAAKFAGGGYAIAIGPGMEPGVTPPTYSVGETVRVGGREFTIMAVVSPLEPMTRGAGPAFDLELVVPADAFLQLFPGSNLRKFYFNVPDELMDEAAALLADYQSTSAVGMNITSRRTMAQQYQAEIRSSAVMGNAISVVIALVGVLNFINSMVTAILSRKREFAMIQSVGMTKRQLQKMLTLEGLCYAGLTLLAAYALGAFAVGVVVRAVASVGYSTFRFTLLPLAVCTPILLIFALLIPYVCFRRLEKQSIVERLRSID